MAMPTREFAFACVDMMGHLNPLLPLMRALLDRGHRITCFLHDDVKYRKHLDAFGLGSVQLISVSLPNIKNPRPDQPKPSPIKLMLAGGPLAYGSCKCTAMSVLGRLPLWLTSSRQRRETPQTF
jgi:hypothetical protein